MILHPIKTHHVTDFSSRFSGERTGSVLKLYIIRHIDGDRRQAVSLVFALTASIAYKMVLNWHNLPLDQPELLDLIDTQTVYLDSNEWTRAL